MPKELSLEAQRTQAMSYYLNALNYINAAWASLDNREQNLNAGITQLDFAISALRQVMSPANLTDMANLDTFKQLLAHAHGLLGEHYYFKAKNLEIGSHIDLMIESFAKAEIEFKAAIDAVASFQLTFFLTLGQSEKLNTVHQRLVDIYIHLGNLFFKKATLPDLSKDESLLNKAVKQFQKVIRNIHNINLPDDEKKQIYHLMLLNLVNCFLQLNKVYKSQIKKFINPDNYTFDQKEIIYNKNIKCIESAIKILENLNTHNEEVVKALSDQCYHLAGMCFQFSQFYYDHAKTLPDNEKEAAIFKGLLKANQSRKTLVKYGFNEEVDQLEDCQQLILGSLNELYNIRMSISRECFFSDIEMWLQKVAACCEAKEKFLISLEKKYDLPDEERKDLGDNYNLLISEYLTLFYRLTERSASLDDRKKMLEEAVNLSLKAIQTFQILHAQSNGSEECIRDLAAAYNKSAEINSLNANLCREDDTKMDFVVNMLERAYEKNVQALELIECLDAAPEDEDLLLYTKDLNEANNQLKLLEKAQNDRPFWNVSENLIARINTSTGSDFWLSQSSPKSISPQDDAPTTFRPISPR